MAVKYPHLGGGLKHIGHFPDLIPVVCVFRFDGQGNLLCEIFFGTFTVFQIGKIKGFIGL